MKVAVIGGGIAGVSVAYELARHTEAPEVVLVEAEATLAHHTTGRSAAVYIENYGAMPVRALTRQSAAFFNDPPEGLVDAPLLHNRPHITVADHEQGESIDEMLADSGGSLTEIPVAEAGRRFPILRTERWERAVVEPESSDIDVAALHQAFVRGCARHGAAVRTEVRIDRIARTASGWELGWADGTLGADIVVNAAGAWGDVVGKLAGVEPVGLRPLRRTAFMVRSSHESADWPFLSDADHNFYIKPDGAQFLCSPADETPSAPCDAKPEEIDIALAIDRINDGTTLGIRSVTSSWAGLRTFTEDRAMVIGPDPDDPAFVWLVGQGGTGIQTAPGAAAHAADLAMGGPGLPGVDTAALSPARLRS